jgi:porin
MASRREFAAVCVLACSLATATVAESDDNSATPATNQAEDVDGLAMDNPGSIAEQFREDTALKEYKFQIPGFDRVLSPWADLRTELDEKYGFRPNISATHLYQEASDTVGPEDSVSGYELVVDGTWTFAGRNTPSPTTAGFELLYRDFTSDLPPVALFTQVGSLYPTTVAFSEVDPSVGQLWLQKQFDKRWGFRVGKLFPVSAYDFFPLKNFRTDFMDAIHGANFIMPLPDRGLGGYLMYRPQPNSYVRIGVHDANADAEEFGFDSLFDEGELFSILELGFDPGLKERLPGRPPFGDVHISIWHQDQRDDDRVAEAWGFILSGSQRFGRFLPFLRYGYSDSDSEAGTSDPTPIEHMVNAGVGIDNIFGQSNDRIGIGVTWSRPTDSALDDQGALDMYYRIQLTPEIAISPTLHLVFDPVRNPDEDEIFVWGLRTRFVF